METVDCHHTVSDREVLDSPELKKYNYVDLTTPPEQEHDVATEELAMSTFQSGLAFFSAAVRSVSD